MPIFDELVVVSKDTPNFAYPGSDGLVVVDGQSVLSNDSDNPLKISAYDHKITCKGCSGGGGTLDGAVRYDIVQTLTDAEKKRARDNIGITDDPTPPTPVPGDCLWEETTETFIPFYLHVSKTIDAPTVEEFNKFVDRFYELETESSWAFSGDTQFGEYKAALKAQYANYLAAMQSETPAQYANRIFVSVTEDGGSADGQYSRGYDFGGEHCHTVYVGESSVEGEPCDKIAVDLPYMSKSYAASIPAIGNLYNGEGDYAKRINIVDVDTFNSLYDTAISEGSEVRNAVLDALKDGGFVYNRTYEENIYSQDDRTSKPVSFYDNLILCAKPIKSNGVMIEDVVTRIDGDIYATETKSVLRPHILNVDLYAVTNADVRSGGAAVFSNSYKVQRKLVVALPTYDDLTQFGSGVSVSKASLSGACSNLGQFGIVETFAVTTTYDDFTQHTFSVIVPKSGKIAKAKPFETN